MKGYQAFTALAFVIVALWLASCGSTDPTGLSRSSLGGGLSTSSTANDTTVQSSSGLGCTASVNPTTVKSGSQATVSVNVTGATGTFNVPQAGIVNSSQPSVQYPILYTLTSGTSHTFTASVTVVDSAGNSASCTYRITITL